MKSIFNIILLFSLLIVFSSCDRVSRMAHKLEEKSQTVNHYEALSYQLEKKNRLLRSKIMDLEDRLEKSMRRKDYFKRNLTGCENRGSSNKREIASIARIGTSKILDNIKVDYVNYDAYKWTPNQIIAVAETEFENKNYEKASQFFQTFLMHFPSHKYVDDQMLFQAGVAAYESKRHYNWAIDGLNRIVVEYPASSYYRGAKLWTALAKLQQGDKKSFFKTVEEFRKKYRNTPEWKILRKHYEEIVKKYKPN